MQSPSPLLTAAYSQHSPATPSTSASPSSKRYLEDDEFDEGQDSDYDSPQPPSKKGKQTKGGRSSGDKAARKAARMARNRVAAQASRDRKKNHVEVLEARVAELEALLSASPVASTSTSTTPALSPSISSLSLEEENANLRLQLSVEQHQSASLKARLGSLEDKFAKLESLLRSPSPSVPLVESAPSTTNTEIKDSPRLVAREVSLQRKLSPSSVSVVPLSTSTLPERRPRPTLTQILSSISVPPSLLLPSTTATRTTRPSSLIKASSIKLGEIGPTRSSYPTLSILLKTRSSPSGQRQRQRRTRPQTTERLSTCSRTSIKNRLRLFVRR